uniref:NTR domain-containing protein n=1 Tax=Arion vulgaris TaxID=1028688 RepID=A0A0B7BJ94_9EUPU
MDYLKAWIIGLNLLSVIICSPLHFVILPNVLRMETEEVVSVTSPEAEDDVTYKIYLQDYPGRKDNFSETTITVHPGDVGIGKVTIRVADIKDASTTVNFVYLVVETVGQLPYFKEEARLLINESPGYIFIQTDKPIYTPDQAVCTRVMTLDEGFRPVKWPIQVDIQNPDGMTISRKVIETTNMFASDVMKIPENPVYGNWTVTAKFTNGLKTSGSVRFEVKEYVLPTFSVTFHIPDDRKVILPNDTNFNLAISAKYTYGKPVKGHVTVTFGLLWHGHVFTVGKRRNMQLNTTGYTDCSITSEELKLPVQTVWFPNGGKLHMQASVTEAASGRVETSDDVSVVFSDHLYIIKFTRSSRYFKPGLPYVLEIDVFMANGQQGSNLPLTVECKTETQALLLPTRSSPQLSLTTDVRGKLSLHYLIPRHVKSLRFKVITSSVTNDKSSSSDYYFGVSPFYSPSSVYLQVHAELTDVDSRGDVPKVGDHITVTTRYTSAEDIRTVNVVVIARGRVVWQVSTRNIQGNFTTLHFKLTQEMSPGVRILAFSVLRNELGSEVISDSVWMDIVAQCDGELSIHLEDDRKKVFRPGDIGTITLSGLPNTFVGVVAVDSAVYLMKNSSLTRQSVFQQIKDHDRGCGCGSGRDTSNVFENAGLTVLTNAGLEIPTKLVEGCLDKNVKKKRSVESSKRIQEVCCLEGLKLRNATLALCYQISRELKAVLTSDLCAREFFSCCRDVVKGNVSLDAAGRLKALEDKLPQELELTFGDEILDMTNVPLRTNFPEAWWFEEYNLGPEGKADVDFVLPDSITTWSVQAIGMSQQAGLCVAPPLEIATFSSFFVHLDLPYSVIRLEQLEVRATVYNYLNRRLRVNVVLQSTDGVCYSGQPGHRTESVKLEIGPHDAASAYFPLVPLEIGEFPIRVLAVSSWGRDAVEKTLRVQGEGLEKVHTVSVMLDPSGKRFLRSRSSNHSFYVKNEVKVEEKRQSVELDLDLPQEVIPDTDSCTVHAMGDLLAPTLQVMIEGVDQLLRIPTGCGEQNLIYLAPNVYVTRYLRATRRLSAAIEKKATILIRQGVARQMTFRKPDASYATWPHADSSTWLTAFAMKTLCQAEHYVTIDHNQTCESLAWIADQQNTDGSFKEETWVTHREMLGGVNGDVSHAAYIITALMECDCQQVNQRRLVEAAQRYVEAKIAQTDRPLAVAISAYAMTLAGSQHSETLVKRLLSLAKSSPEGFTYWAPGSESDFGTHEKPYWYTKKPGALAVEVTAYALLTFLARGDVTTSTNIVGWLLQQRNSHGAFISTQDTVVGLQALSEYSIKSYSAILDMTCHIRSEVDDRFRKSISLTPKDAMVLKSVPKVPTGGKLHFEAEGTGVGMLQVEVRFNVPEDTNECRFDVKVTNHRHNSLLQSFFWDGKRSRCEPCSIDCEHDDYDEEDEDDGDVENFTFPSINPRIQTLLREIHGGRDMGNVSHGDGLDDNESRADINNVLFGSRIGRPKRSVKAYSASVICLEICVRHTGESSTGMSVVDAGLFTGYEPVVEDLDILKLRGKIDHYEKSQRSVVLYLDQISNKDETCLKFRAKQVHSAENIQPASIQIYDYYNPEERCTIFYKANNNSGQLVNFCDNQKQICQCLESRCGYCEESWQGLTWMDMMKFACTNATHVLEVKALDRDLEKAGFERILGQIVGISTQKGHHVVKEGDKVILLKRSSCYCPKVSLGQTYLMMLADPKRFKDSDGNQVYVFLLDKKVFVLEILKPKGLSGTKKDIAKNIRRTLKRLERRKCSNNSTAQINRKQKRAKDGKFGERKKT